MSREGKAAAVLKSMRIVILTTSEEERDIAVSYERGASPFVTKPADFNDFVGLARTPGEYWFGLVELPPHKEGC